MSSYEKAKQWTLSLRKLVNACFSDVDRALPMRTSLGSSSDPRLKDWKSSEVMLDFSSCFSRSCRSSETGSPASQTSPLNIPLISVRVHDLGCVCHQFTVWQSAGMYFKFGNFFDVFGWQRGLTPHIRMNKIKWSRRHSSTFMKRKCRKLS